MPKSLLGKVFRDPAKDVFGPSYWSNSLTYEERENRGAYTKQLESNDREMQRSIAMIQAIAIDYMAENGWDYENISKDRDTLNMVASHVVAEMRNRATHVMPGKLGGGNVHYELAGEKNGKNISAEFVKIALLQNRTSPTYTPKWTPQTAEHIRSPKVSPPYKAHTRPKPTFGNGDYPGWQKVLIPFAVLIGFLSRLTLSDCLKILALFVLLLFAWQLLT